MGLRFSGQLKHIFASVAAGALLTSCAVTPPERTAIPSPADAYRMVAVDKARIKAEIIRSYQADLTIGYGFEHFVRQLKVQECVAENLSSRLSTDRLFLEYFKPLVLQTARDAKDFNMLDNAYVMIEGVEGGPIAHGLGIMIACNDPDHYDVNDPGLQSPALPLLRSFYPDLK